MLEPSKYVRGYSETRSSIPTRIALLSNLLLLLLLLLLLVARTSVTQTIQRRMRGDKLKYEFERMWRELILTSFKDMRHCSDICLERLSKAMKIVAG
jgi:hypothetical protein